MRVTASDRFDGARFRCLMGLNVVEPLTPHRRINFALDDLAATSTGSSTRIAAAMLLHEPASLDKGEITDKGSLNQRAVLQHRNDLVEELYSAEASSRVIVARPKK